MSRLSTVVVLCFVGVVCGAPVDPTASTTVNGRNIVNFDTAIMNSAIQAVENSLTQEQKDKVNGIFNNKSLTKAQLKSEMGQAFDSFGEPMASQFKNATDEVTKFVDKAAARNDQEILKKSPEAQALYKELAAILENDSLTPSQDAEQVAQAYNKAPPEAKAEVDSLVKQDS